VLLAVGASCPLRALAVDFQTESMILKVSEENNKLEITTNTSRILTLDKNIPRVQVNNPDLLAVTPLSATQIQISARKAGVTQVNLWDEEGQIHTVDVMIYGDVAELDAALRTQFPNSSIKVYRYSESMVLKGFTDQPEHVSAIMRMSEDYAPKVINNITVGGVQQVLLKVKVMEVSRTKLRRLGVDWAYLGSGGGYVLNSIGDMLSIDGADLLTTNADTFSFGIVKDGQAFFGLLEALQQNRVAKILAEPNLVAVSGRPAKFMSGGEIAYLVAQGGVGQTTFSIQFREFGTIVDFVPIVLGNGNIRLEVRPEVSSPDFTLGTMSNGSDVPGFRKRFVETAVEMKAGQTFAIAGLVDERVDTVTRGLPYISQLPIIGVPFRRVQDEVNEIELLIMVTPEFVDAIEPHEVPCGGPGYATTSPVNNDLYCAGHVEVPAHCNPISGVTVCGEGCGNQCNGCVPAGSFITDGVALPGGTGYDDPQAPGSRFPGQRNGRAVEPDAIRLPPSNGPEESLPLDTSASTLMPSMEAAGAFGASAAPQYTVPRPYSPPRTPVFVRNASSPDNRYVQPEEPAAASSSQGLFGPVGYDAE
jgi:pilus assembly protein CpaC